MHHAGLKYHSLTFRRLYRLFCVLRSRIVLHRMRSHLRSWQQVGPREATVTQTTRASYSLPPGFMDKSQARAATSNLSPNGYGT